jgi:protein-L-isoaspartate(D-aspartate) O-methyltransferase
MNKSELIEEVRSYLRYFKKVNEKDEKILKAIKEVDRKNFMPKNKELAYENEAVPIGHNQTISQPATVARMLSLLELKKTDTVLEIGTGSAWNAALLGYLTKKVTTLEIVKPLAEKSKNRLEKLKIKNVTVKQQDFRKIKQKFDKIIFTAGILSRQDYIIEDYAKTHLNDNGILVCPHQSGSLIIIKKKGDKLKTLHSKEHYVFVPLILE